MQDELMDLDFAINAVHAEIQDIELTVEDCPHCECGNKLRRINFMKNELLTLQEKRSDLEMETAMEFESLDNMPEESLSYQPQFDYAY